MTSTAGKHQPITTRGRFGGSWRAAWRSTHTPAPGVPGWALVCALAVPFAVLPSCLWRIGISVLHHGDLGRGDVPSWVPMGVYVVALSIASELLAFTAVGMVATWGEHFPRWIPLLRGRRVPTLVAVIPATVGAAALTVVWTAALVVQLTGVTLQGQPLPDNHPSKAGGLSTTLFYVSYAPLLLWGPLLAAVTVAYVRRRRRAE